MATHYRFAWPIVVMLAAAPSSEAFAQTVACYPIQRGDTASRLAKRVTGNASDKYQPWFDIEDVLGRSVPKSQYDRVRFGWRACILDKAVRDRVLEARHAIAEVGGTRVESAAGQRSADTPRAIQGALRPGLIALQARLNLNPVHIGLGAAVFIPALGFLIVGAYARRLSATTTFMSQFGHLFVREFERPLLPYAEEPAIRAQLRLRPYRARLEIRLAPGKGRRYPNLSDHRKNVEYDVDRVLSALADDAFVRGRLRMRDGWVVVPFRFSARLKQRGVRCISSL